MRNNSWSRRVIGILLLCISRNVAGISCQDLIFVKEMPVENSKMALLASRSGKRFLIKQRKECTVHGRVMPILETFGTSLAHSMGICANKVRLISAPVPCSFKFYKDYPATLHTFVPGMTVRNVKRFHDLNINQTKQGGLTPWLIEQMARHPDLPKIAALDTFLGNKRNRDNLLYDEKSDRFYAIDFGSTLRRPFARTSIAVAKGLISRSISLKDSEMQALFTYYTALKDLLASYPLKKLIACFERLIKQSGLSAQSHFCHARKIPFLVYLRGSKNRLISNYRATRILVGLIERYLVLNRALTGPFLEKNA